MAEGDGGQRWPARGLEWEGVDVVGRGCRPALLAERLGDDDDVLKLMGASQGSTQGGKQGRKGGGEGWGGGNSKGEVGELWEADPGVVSGRWGPRTRRGWRLRASNFSFVGRGEFEGGRVRKKNWERGKKVDREEQRAGGAREGYKGRK